MKEPKRLAHRQAERNKARALKHWDWDEDVSEPVFAESSTQPDSDNDNLILAGATAQYQL